VAEPACTPAYISTPEADRVRPSDDALRHLAERLGVGFEELATGRPARLATELRLRLLLLPPPAPGSYSAGREAAQRAAQGVGTFPALPAGDPVELTLAEFGARAIAARPAVLDAASVRRVKQPAGSVRAAVEGERGRGFRPSAQG
jgi:transcriptional regulator with XRE-family HTH domain